MVTKTKIKAYQEFSRRLHHTCDLQHVTKDRGRARALSRLLNGVVGYKGVSKWLDGDSMPDMAHATMLATLLGVRFEWLMTGRGSVRDDKQLAAQDETGVYHNLSEPTVRFARQWQSLPTSIKEAIEHLLIALNEQHAKKNKRG